MYQEKKDKIFRHQTRNIPKTRSNLRLWPFPLGILALLVFRIILSTFNVGTGLANLVYLASFPFVAPFFYIFEEPLSFATKSGVAEVATLVALLFIFLVSYVLIKLLKEQD